MKTRSLTLVLALAVVSGLAPAMAGTPKVVFLSGDEEYRSEESLPMLAKMLRRDFGFDVEVGFSLGEDGLVNPMANASVTKMEALAEADLLVFYLRFRQPGRDSFQHFLDYVAAGKPVVAFRTSTHAFRFPHDSGLEGWGYQSNPDQANSFGGGDKLRDLLGQKWITHHGHFDDGKNPLTEVTLAPGQSGDALHPVLRGVAPFQAFSWLYHVEGGGDTVAGEPVFLLQGRALQSSKIERGETERYPLVNPVAWAGSYQSEGGAKGRVFTTTLGHPYDFKDPNMRRLSIQGMLWALGMEDRIPEDGVNADTAGEFEPNNSGFGADKFKQGLKPEDLFPGEG